jgi:hypothetical protein
MGFERSSTARRVSACRQSAEGFRFAEPSAPEGNPVRVALKNAIRAAKFEHSSTARRVSAIGFQRSRPLSAEPSVPEGNPVRVAFLNATHNGVRTQFDCPARERHCLSTPQAAICRAFPPEGNPVRVEFLNATHDGVRTQFDCPARQRLVARVPKASVSQSLPPRKAIPLGSPPYFIGGTSSD